MILAAPPGFRPQHFKIAVEAGKHVFAEKPVAVDAPGVRSVLDTCALAKKKGLSVVSGLCLRYDNGFRETVKRPSNSAWPPDLPVPSTFPSESTAPHKPAGMVFVRNPSGVSHAPEEEVDMQDAAVAANALLATLERLA